MALTEKLTSIADAIRGKTGGASPLTLDQMAEAIVGIQVGGGSGDGLAYDMGEFVFDSDTLTGVNVTIPHNLGTPPEFVCVWTDHWAGLTSENPITYEDAKDTAVGFIWMKEITGTLFRLSSAASAPSLCITLNISGGDYRVSPYQPSSSVYGIPESEYHRITDKVFCLPNLGVYGSCYRAGVTYKYFVSHAWWNVGGVASAE